MRNKYVLAFCVVAALAVVGVETRSLRRDVAAAPGLGAKHFPNVVLKTHEGKTVRFYDDIMKGDKIVMVNFMYAKCNGICPGATRNLVKAQQMLKDRVGKDIFMYSITLSPETDTPEVLAEYVQSHKIQKGWTFLTGSKADIELLRRSLGFVDPDPDLDKIRSNHSGMVLMGNETIDRYIACAALGNPERLVETVLWMESPTMRQKRQHAVDRGGV